MGKTITVEEIFADLDKSFVKQETYQEGDITIKMLMDRYELSQEAAYKQFTNFNHPGYVKLKVNAGGAKTWVIRKLE